jgi:selenocysteine-specific elongation factor
VGEEITFYPGGLTARIRGIQVHGRDVDLVEAGHRTAINLQGIEKEQINRGDMAASPGSMVATTLLDASFLYLQSAGRDLKNRTQVRVHLGTREIPGRIALLESETLAPGEETHIQLILHEPVAAWPGDRYVVRSASPITTIGGGAPWNATANRTAPTSPRSPGPTRRSGSACSSRRAAPAASPPTSWPPAPARSASG